ncbi:MAG: tRNA lysidine(34) synthetase TilS [Candidatus Eremiobacteraeota bacterium]|nr:tRNA lysidine(34) synthetase TilS [Candidatus Eremiobacteraeota bacterium]
MRGAHPERDVERALVQSGVLPHGERLLIACSGGPDSVALTGALQAVAKHLALTLFAAFIDHGVRESARQDECVALALAARYEIPLETIALSASGADEQRLRAARYRALCAAAKRRACEAVVTAHHAEDQSETVVLALLRGTGPGGLRGMPRRRRIARRVDLVRPLIGVPSETLRAYCHAKALPYAVDPTNAHLGVRRNAVREALATLRPLFPELDRAVARAAQLVADEQDASPRAGLRNSIRERLAAEEGLRDVDFTHVEAAVRALELGGSGTFHMKPGIVLRIERGSIRGITRW